MIYSDWLKQWLDDYVKPTTKIRTYNRYKEIAEQHIIPRLGKYDLDELSVSILQHYITELLQNGNLITGEGLAVNSVNSVINVLQNSLRTAYNIGIAKEYEADKLKRPKAEEKLVECFSVSEQRMIERAVLDSKKDKMIGILLCLYSGLRIGELLALEWKDVDLQNGILLVSKSCHDGKDKNGKFTRITESPKTSCSMRTIPISKQMLSILKTMKKKSRSTYVISNGEKPITVRAYQRSFETLLKKIEVRRKGFHSLRHTFATRALECGMDVKTLSEILGHKSPTVTLNRYAHSLIEHKKEMMNRVGKLIEIHQIGRIKKCG